MLALFKSRSGRPYVSPGSTKVSPRTFVQPGVYGSCNESVELCVLVEAAASETETIRADFGLGKCGWMNAVGLDRLPNDWRPRATQQFAGSLLLTRG